MEVFSCLSHLQCTRCNRTFAVDERIQTCSCGAPLLARYDLQQASRHLTKAHLRERPCTLWRYHELLPVRDPHFVVSMNESMTPLIPLHATGRHMDVPHLILKDEGALPSGTFKARGASVGVSKAMELGESSLAITTNGNAGAAWSLYAARAGIHISVVMPIDAPVTSRKECALAGADLSVIHGTIADGGQLVQRLVAQSGGYDVSTLKEPYRLEGKKTMGFEIAEQFDWSAPDVIVYPTGGGAGVIGIYKAFRELQELGWIGSRLPRLVVVQAEGCAPLVRAFQKGEHTSTPWKNPETIAFGLRVPKALGDFLILDALYQTAGTAVSVGDGEIVRERGEVARRDGVHVCPEGAAALAGVRRLRQQGWIGDNETVLVMNTGSGLKYVDQLSADGREIDLQESSALVSNI